MLQQSLYVLLCAIPFADLILTTLTIHYGEKLSNFFGWLEKVVHNCIVYFCPCSRRSLNPTTVSWHCQRQHTLFINAFGFSSVC